MTERNCCSPYKSFQSVSSCSLLQCIAIINLLKDLSAAEKSLLTIFTGAPTTYDNISTLKGKIFDVGFDEFVYQNFSAKLLLDQSLPNREYFVTYPLMSCFLVGYEKEHVILVYFIYILLTRDAPPTSPLLCVFRLISHVLDDNPTYYTTSEVDK